MDSDFIAKKFRQHEKVRRQFKKHGYDMDGSRKEVLKRAGKIAGPVLDVGTGPGRIAYTLALAGYKVTSVDISAQAQAIARLYADKFKVREKIRFLKMDAEKLDFKDNSFKTVISVNLLHDVKSPKKVIKEIIRVCRPGGKIVITDLNEKGKDIVNRVYRINKEIHRGKNLNLDRVVGGSLKNKGIVFKKYDGGPLTIFTGEKPL